MKARHQESFTSKRLLPSRILLLTFFYPPDLSAGSFRASALVEALQLRVGANVNIEVITTQPNRYTSQALEAMSVEESPGLKVRRIRLPQMREGFVGQAVAFWCYMREVRRLTVDQDYDLVLATSSRLMTAVLGAWISFRRQTCLYLDVRDIFVENLKVLFPAPIAIPLGWVFGALERWAINRADKVNLVSYGFMDYFQPRYPGRQFSFFSNGVDGAFIDCALDSKAGAAGQPLQVLYAGNIGDGQGLHLIVPELAERLRGRVIFRIVGGGGRLDVLRETVLARNLDNVELVEPVPRAELLGMYSDADILFLHLNDFEAFRRVLPSKLFEYAATGKPIWAGVAGHAAAFISVELTNVAVFPPCDARQAMLGFERLELGCVDRGAFVERYARARIMQAMALDVLDLLEPA